MTPPSPTRPVLARVGPAALVLVVLVVAALLVRGGTAVDEDEVAAVRSSLAPAPVASPSAGPVPPPPAPTVDVRPDGVDGLRLGMTAAEVSASGLVVQADGQPDCRRVSVGPQSAVPGSGVSGWLLDGQVVAVTVDARAGRGSSFLGVGVGGRLQDLPSGEAVRRSRAAVDVPWQPEPVRLALARVRSGAGVAVTFADLTGSGVVDHVQVLADAGAGCAPAAAALRARQVRSLPPLEPDGRGEVRVGRLLEDVRQEVSLPPAVPAAQVGRPCRLVLADEEPGLVYVVVSPDDAGRDVVRAVTVDAGATARGLRVGDPAERVAELYPGLTTSYLQQRWGQGLIADWRDGSGTFRLAPAREQVVVPEVDAVLRGPGLVVGQVQVGPGC